MRFTLLPAAVVAICVCPARARQGAWQLEQFEPRPHGAGILGVSAPAALPAGGWALDLWSSYAREPLALEPVTAGDPRDEGAVVADRLRLELVGTYAIFAGLQVGGALPFARSFDTGAYGFAGREPDDFTALALGDARLHVDVAPLALVGPGSLLGLSAGLGLTAWLPTGDVASLEGEEAVRFEPRISLQYALAGYRVAADVGYHLRPDNRVFTVDVGDTLRWGVAGRAPLPLDLAVEATVFGAAHLGDRPDPADLTRSLDDRALDPVEALGALRWRFGPGFEARIGGGGGMTAGLGSPAWRLLAGIGFAPGQETPAPAPLADAADADEDGVPDALDVCPLEPESHDGVRDEDGCPEGVPPPRSASEAGARDDERRERDDDEEPPRVRLPELQQAGDRDGDGLDNEDDACPDEPEDLDGFEDGDGCPDPDNDGDGIPDEVDQCPWAAEIYNGVDDEDGCPDVGSDSDFDGIEDRLDVCPLEPETHDGLRDGDGCPEGGPVLLDRLPPMNAGEGER